MFSTRMIASLLARIFGPSIYDLPKFGGGGPIYRLPEYATDAVFGPHPDPWSRVALNPQPLPPREILALLLADAYIQELQQLDRVAMMFGGEVEERTTERALRQLAVLEELCPRWPRWPKRWPPPPPPPWQRDEMTSTELLVYGSRFLAAAEFMETGPLQDGLARLGTRAMEMSASG